MQSIYLLREENSGKGNQGKENASKENSRIFSTVRLFKFTCNKTRSPRGL